MINFFTWWRFIHLFSCILLCQSVKIQKGIIIYSAMLTCIILCSNNTINWQASIVNARMFSFRRTRPCPFWFQFRFLIPCIIYVVVETFLVYPTYLKIDGCCIFFFLSFFLYLAICLHLITFGMGLRQGSKFQPAN